MRKEEEPEEFGGLWAIPTNNRCLEAKYAHDGF